MKFKNDFYLNEGTVISITKLKNNDKSKKRRSSIINYPLGNDNKEITDKKKKLEICDFNLAAWAREKESLLDDDIITEEGGRVERIVKVRPAVGDDVVDRPGNEEKKEKW